MTESALSLCCFPRTHDENPVLDVLYAPLESRGWKLKEFDWITAGFMRVDAFHVHWPDAVVMGRSLGRTLMKFALFQLSVYLFTLRRIPIIYHVHNIGSHDRSYPRIERLLWKLFLPRVQCFIHMSEFSRRTALEMWPNTRDARHEVILAPRYRPVTVFEPRVRCRVRLGLPQDAHVFLNFGLMRPYKGIEAIVSAFRALADQNARLVLAGRSYTPEYGAWIDEMIWSDPRIVRHDRFLDESELEAVIRASNTVIMGHLGLMNSGVAIRALSSGTAILAPALGALPEIKAHVDLEQGDDWGWVTLFDELKSETLARRLAHASDPERKGPTLDFIAPGRIADQFHRLLLEIIKRKSGMRAPTARQQA